MTVAALFVDPQGIYAGLPDVDLWDESRDARLYAGPWSVVAHPPCARWSNLAHLVQANYGYEIGDDGGCFESALRSVRTYGGVLEHPAYTMAWAAFDLPRPPRGTWQQSLFDNGWVTEVSQSAYGYPARKRTWLYLVGEPLELDWSEPFVLDMVSDLGGGNTRQRGKDRLPIGLKHAKASATPVAFRDVLLKLARTSSGVVR